MTYCFDIDGTICTQDGEEYEDAQPKQDIINYLNKLHAAGNTIILYTARGVTTGVDWNNLTRKQLIRWGVNYDSLHFGKPAADVYVDDKAVNVKDLKL